MAIDFDLLAYNEFMNGNLEDYELYTEEIQKAFASKDMPKIDKTKF